MAPSTQRVVRFLDRYVAAFDTRKCEFGNGHNPTIKAMALTTFGLA